MSRRTRASTTVTEGGPAPDFELPALNGELVGLWNCLLEGPVVVEFIRGTWCPNARERLRDLAASRHRIRESPARLLIIVGEDPFTVHRYFERSPTPLTVLLDADRVITKRFGVYQRFGIERWHLARPSTFIIDRAGFVRRIFVARTRIESLPVDEIIESIQRLESATGGKREPG